MNGKLTKTARAIVDHTGDGIQRSKGSTAFIELELSEFTFEAIPEPSTALLLGMGLAILASVRRRRVRLTP